MPKKTKGALLTRAVQNRDRQLASGNRAATVRESVQDGLAQQPARVPGIDKGKLKIADDLDKMSKSELAEWYGSGVLPK
jgi:hypothetical protein